MERPQTPEHCQARIAQAAERMRAAPARVSRAQERLTEAKARLARARLALEGATARDIDKPPADDEPMKPGRPMNGSGPR
jgi:hypothetical protein